MTARVDLEELEALLAHSTAVFAPAIVRHLVTELRDLRARMEGAPVAPVVGNHADGLPRFYAASPKQLHGRRVRLVVCDE